MKPKITIEGFNIGKYQQSIRVIHDGNDLADASDYAYEASDASKCCELLAAMRDAGIIELESNQAAKDAWSHELREKCPQA